MTMEGLKIGDIVGRKSYGCDVLFKVTDIKKAGNENIATLKGITYRIEADAPESDLIVQSRNKIEEYTRRMDRNVEIVEKRVRRPSNNTYMRSAYLKKARFRDTSKDEKKSFLKFGKILHVDGDESYLDICLKEYNKFGITAVGKYLPEKDQPSRVIALLETYRPDILVLTGHDGLLKNHENLLDLASYRNSRYFAEAVRAARKYEADMDSLVIFAGACQSYYAELIKSGANYASSPERQLIHALDPVLVCIKFAMTKIDKVLEPYDIVAATITGEKGIGGVATRGRAREGYPTDKS